MDRNGYELLMLCRECVALRKESVDRNEAWLVNELAERIVALRKESVDRNNVFVKLTNIRAVALRKESVDRNEVTDEAGSVIDVALRKESVDRNRRAAMSTTRSPCRSPQGERG